MNQLSCICYLCQINSEHNALHALNTLHALYALHALHILYAFHALHILYAFHALHILYAFHALHILFAFHALNILYALRTIQIAPYHNLIVPPPTSQYFSFYSTILSYKSAFPLFLSPIISCIPHVSQLIWPPTTVSLYLRICTYV